MISHRKAAFQATANCQKHAAVRPFLSGIGVTDECDGNHTNDRDGVMVQEELFVIQEALFTVRESPGRIFVTGYQYDLAMIVA
jgi:hypothetical protein